MGLRRDAASWGTGPGRLRSNWTAFLRTRVWAGVDEGGGMLGEVVRGFRGAEG